MYIGSVVCYGLGDKQFQTEGEEELKKITTFNEEGIILQNARHQNVYLYIIFSQLFNKFNDNLNLGKIRYYCIHRGSLN